MKIAILLFPGTNRAADIVKCLSFFTKATISFIPPQTTSLDGYNVIIIPGGFSYGDENGYGKIAASQPIIKALRKAVLSGTPTLGICNGFQILIASRLLPGELRANRNKQFIAKNVKLTVVNNNTIFTNKYRKNEVIKLPIANYAGQYWACSNTIKTLEDNAQIVLKYKDNINGSVNNIAAIINKQGNVLGLMPHPENYYISYQGGNDGAPLFRSLLKFIT